MFGPTINLFVCLFAVVNGQYGDQVCQCRRDVSHFDRFLESVRTIISELAMDDLRIVDNARWDISRNLCKGAARRAYVLDNASIDL
jgi:hypothetical protein